nr:integrase, catalytic region, zinc finger, CCHC-type, peptidase aspartic, catalytic [Tanacetum cinerariifolium]
MNMLNRNCKSSFAKPEFLKKAQRENPSLYDIGCYNDNLALMLAPEYDEVIRLEKESRSKLSDLIRPFDYEKLNNLYDLVAPQREKSSTQRYFLERSNSPTSVSRPQLKSNRMEDRVMLNNSQGKKQEVEATKFLGTVKFGNDQIAPILGYRDLVQGEVTIKRVYYVEWLNHNLFSVGQFCDADLEVAFRKSTCYIRDLKGNDLLTGSHGIDLYSITLQDTSSPNPIYLMAKETSSQEWLWHRRLSHLNFDTINLLSKNDIVIRQRSSLFFLDGENFDKIKGKGDACNFVGYSTQSRAYRVFNKRTKVIVETIHVNFDELLQMASDHVSSDLVPQCQSTALKHDSLSPGPQCQENVPHVAETVTTSNELDLLFCPIFDELLNGSTQVMSKSSTVTTADAANQCQQQNTTPLNTQTTPDPTCQVPTQTLTVTSTKNINQEETIIEYAQVKDDEFINIFCTPVQDRWETSSRHVDSSNMHTFYQRSHSEHRWMKDHPLEQVIRNPSQSVRTRRQLESDGEMCMFALTVSRTKPKNIKEAMADFA